MEKFEGGKLWKCTVRLQPSWSSENDKREGEYKAEGPTQSSTTDPEQPRLQDVAGMVKGWTNTDKHAAHG